MRIRRYLAVMLALALGALLFQGALAAPAPLKLRVRVALSLEHGQKADRAGVDAVQAALLVHGEGGPPAAGVHRCGVGHQLPGLLEGRVPSWRTTCWRRPGTCWSGTAAGKVWWR